MGHERMKCCGAITAVYRDAGNRRHNPGCPVTATPGPGPTTPPSSSAPPAEEPPQPEGEQP